MRNKKGATLVLALLAIVVIIIIVVAIMPLVVNEWQMTARWTSSIRAFYAAESGLNRALWALNNYKTAQMWTDNGWNISDLDRYTLSLQVLKDSQNNTLSYYEIVLNNPATSTPFVESAGYSPTTSGTKRSARATLKLTQAAIMAKGGIDIQKNPEIYGEVLEYTDFSFETMFGKTKEEVKQASTTVVVVDPPNNYTPVPATGKTVTWFVLSSSSKAIISTTHWSGSGILIVEGTKAGDSLEITGGDFDGVLWVMGELRIAGNGSIDGAIFVDGSVKDITNITGTPVITYDAQEIIDAFGYNPMPYVRDYWREID